MTDDEPLQNVMPITRSHVCASCKAEIGTLDVYAGHTDKCMQPEIRMRRLETRVATCGRILEENQLRLHEIAVELEHVWRTAALGIGVTDPIPLKEPHGSSEIPTQRTGGDPQHFRCADCAGTGCVLCKAARDRGLPFSDASTAEPAGEAPAGAVPPGAGQERPG
jgi:hypothetical protein